MSGYGIRQICTFPEVWGDPPVEKRVGESRENATNTRGRAHISGVPISSCIFALTSAGKLNISDFRVFPKCTWIHDHSGKPTKTGSEKDRVFSRKAISLLVAPGPLALSGAGTAVFEALELNLLI